jgi:hypothetical protein
MRAGTGMTGQSGLGAEGGTQGQVVKFHAGEKPLWHSRKANPANSRDATSSLLRHVVNKYTLLKQL